MKLKYQGVVLIAVCLSLFAALTQGRARTRADVERGQYLVEVIAQCGMCHTPRNERGEFEPGRWLRGGPLEFESAHAAADWPTSAPAIAGLPGWSRAEAIRFLQTGITRNGNPPRRPMPQYRMRHDDAEAIVAYLKSLKTGPS